MQDYEPDFFPLSAESRWAEDSYRRRVAAYRWERNYGIDYLYCGSLFTHQLFPIYVAALLWGGLYLRDRRVRALLRA